MHSKLIKSLPNKTDRELKTLIGHATKKDVDIVLQAAINELSKRHPILANNCRGLEHEKEYGLDAVIDYIPAQLGNIPVAEIRDIVRFQYEGSMIRIDTFTDCHSNNEDTNDSEHPDLCFYGKHVNKKVVTKEDAANLYPPAFNKKGHFCQFTFKRS